MPFMTSVGRDCLERLFNPDLIVQQAKMSLEAEPVHITDAVAAKSPGTAHDYYSNGDYWWPNPETPDGLPYIRRDGESNPGNFHSHRILLRQMRTHVARLASAYAVTGQEEFAEKAVLFLKRFFLDEETRMNPHLLYAQAIPGVCEGRGIGIIDTLHLIDVPIAIQALQSSPHKYEEIAAGLKIWFADYLRWMSTNPNGIEEMNERNNHSVCWFVQAAVFAHFTENDAMLNFCRKRYKEKLLPDQMDMDGSFPRELARTKPYAYSIFQLDNLVTLCHVLSTPEDNLWTYCLPDGRSIEQGLRFLLPYLINKESWPYPPDVETFDDWPVGMSSLLFAGLALKRNECVDLWVCLDKDPQDVEIRRNIAIREPLLWLLA
ncbi:hypothetical protein PAECIP111802_05733 [Paenibacillus allorhizosphaerae]|uniref:Alginate lyase domain-containing protein n=2 Tax=Paenibacillus allorhizosphaerae TaxID=2849866 RepID=A0ABM8VQI9_9BACL|nr:hypothetical protein PAECIP111802_05733 [Paenibacillus allorhizosphaerae]